MSAASSARLLRQFVHPCPASVKRTVRDLDDSVDDKAVDAHDATDVAKRPRDELQSLTSDVELLDLRSSAAIVVSEDEVDLEEVWVKNDDAVSYSHPDLHGFYRFADFTALGRPIVRAHQHAAGLTELHFDNCCVKVRVGIDLNDLIRCSANGKVALRNLSTNGWVTNSSTLLPSFVFLKYLSGFDR
jgi:hypothetical protein